nr:ATP-binding cassette domain-containing protein [Erwinia sp. S38]
MLAALRGGVTDRLLLTLADLLLSVPGLLLLTLVVTVSGTGYLPVVVAAVLVMLPDIFRLVRAAALRQLEQDYVDIARGRGETSLAIMLREIAPNLLPLLAADVGIRLLSAIFILSTASFLGLGAIPPQADWGLMIMENRQGLTVQPWAVLAPTLAILLLVLPLTLSVERRPRRRSDRIASVDSLCHLKPPEAGRVLVMRDVSLALPQQILLKRVSLTITKGEVVALVGSSGAGKSTLLHAALGQLPLTVQRTSGAIWLAGQSVLSCSSAVLRRLRRSTVGYVPQDPRLALMSAQTVGGYLRIMARSRGISARQRRAQTRVFFREFGLPEESAFLRRYPHQLSGGQRQRVMLAAALLGFPALLVMDEPTSALDPLGTRTLLAWVARMARKRGMSVLFVAHDLPQASQIADRIVVMNAGEIVETQRTADFLRRPQTPFAGRLLAAWQPQSLHHRPVIAGKPQLIVEQLVARYGQQTTVGPVNVALAPGQTLTLAGRSGCGKTTLLRALAGLHARMDGAMLLGGDVLPFAVEARSLAQHRRLQYVAQNPASSLNPFYTVESLLDRPLMLHVPGLSRAERRRRIYQVLDQVGLSASLGDCRISTLSGGQQQRVALARALIIRPDIVLCDEVTSGADGMTRQALVQLLISLQQQRGVALLMVTHDLTLPAQMGGTLMVMDEGRVVEQGSVRQLFEQPAHPVTRQMIEASRLGTRFR